MGRTPSRQGRLGRHPSSRALLAGCAAAGLLAVIALACTSSEKPTVPLSHEAYVWQRLWTPELSEAVVAAPSELGALRVLARERSGPARTPVDVSVDTEALARGGRPVVAVLRVDGTAPLDGVSLEEVTSIARAWRSRGVRVRGVEVDHDCATASLESYAAWLEREKASARDMTLSITALPTWTASPALPRLLATVDDVVVQVHAVRAPRLFEATQARAWLEAWAQASRRPFRVALPTYRTRLRDGTPLAAEPPDIARFVAGLRERPVPGLAGILWFRLGHRADPDAWSLPTLAAVLRQQPLTPRLVPRLLDAGGGTLDIAIENAGPVDALAPSRISFNGHLDILDGVRGYAPAGPSLVTSKPPRVRAGETLVIGFVRGTEISLAHP